MRCLGFGYVTWQMGWIEGVLVFGLMLMPGTALAQKTAMSTSEIDAFREQVSACWVPPAVATNAADLGVQLKIWLNPDGSLARPPEVIGDGVPPSVFQRAAEDAALQAMRRCAPFRMPEDKYAYWREVEIRFDPSPMFER